MNATTFKAEIERLRRLLEYVSDAAPRDDSDGEPIEIRVTPEALRQIRAALLRLV